MDISAQGAVPVEIEQKMNRRERRASRSQAGWALPSGTSGPAPLSSNVEDAYAAAVAHYRRRELIPAQRLCREILSHTADHVDSLVLLGDMVQQDGRNKQAVKLLTQALAIDPCSATAHDNLAIAYQALGRRDEAVAHFTQALTLGLAGAETLIKHSAALAAPLQRLASAWPRALTLAELLGEEGASPLGREALLLALLQLRPVHDIELERLLTAIRRGVLHCAVEGSELILDADAAEYYSALAQQCFINEYVFALSEGERTQLAKLQAHTSAALDTGASITPRDLIAAASYLPLHTLPKAAALLQRTFPAPIARLLVQQIGEPLEEAADLKNIPTLTPIDDVVSLQVQRQYEENPYPRWIAGPPIEPTTLTDFLAEHVGAIPASWDNAAKPIELLNAGCGTGAHSIDTARRFTQTQVLAVDMSRASLAYARRKTRALGLSNIEYGQADILKLASLGRQFDVIEAAGVLHHLADPAAAWRLLLSLLRPNGLMFVGLYSATARQLLGAARALIAERGHKPVADDIRAYRQDLMSRYGLPPFSDFSSTSGCRDLLFNVMEHEFTIPDIAAFLDANRLTFLGFGQLPSDVRERFRQQFPDPAARPDLAAWHAFEQKNPYTFGNMYFFWVQKSETA
jgi:2-polyprenyl-3-methyl-5-hydroxy-6-metoxy-1,4-benzoquinol methylase/tetratricopeptide (TPR) repeat protein